MGDISNKLVILGATGIVAGMVYTGHFVQSNGLSLYDSKYNIEFVTKSVRYVMRDYSRQLQDLVIAQAILESNLDDAPPSGLARKGSNLFGIKWSTKCISKPVTYSTVEHVKGKDRIVNQVFAHFDSINDGIACRAKMFDFPRYQNVKTCTSFEDCAKRIHKSGYATDPNYEKLLIKVKNQHLKEEVST